jgi:hypothetical protein
MFMRKYFVGETGKKNIQCEATIMTLFLAIQ